jgi:glycosyltransferase involved in cell wall biosynthesis
VPEHDSPGPEAAEGAARPEVAVEADLHSLSTEPLTAEGDDIEILRKCVAGLAEEELEHISDGLADVFRDSLQYRLGDELIQSAKNPASLPLLPFRLWQIYQAWNARRRGPTLPSDGLATEGNFHWAKRLSFEDIGAIVQTDFLAGVFFRSLRAFDYQRAHLTLQRIEHLEKQRGEDIALSQRLSTHFPDDMRLALGGETALPALRLGGKKICYFLHNSLPYASGGYATRAHGLAKALSSIGYDVHAVTRPGFPLDERNDVSATDLVPDVVIDAIQYHRILEPSRKKHRNAEYMRRSAAAIEAFLQKERPAYVIAASNYYTSLPALIAARKLGIPFVYEVRGFWEVTRLSREPSFRKSPEYALQEFMEAETCRRADHVITLTAAMKTELVRRGVTAETITLAPNACSPSDFAPAERNAELAQIYGIPPNVKVIGYIGSFVQYEGLDDLARACASLKAKGIEFRLLIVGSENVSTGQLGPIAAAIKAEAVAGQYKNWLLMPGRVPHEKVRDYYSLVDIAAFPRKPQPVTEMVSPMKPLEAMSMQKAVVVSSVAALSEMILEGTTGLTFEKGNVKDLATKLERLIADDSLRQRLGHNARAWVEAERSWVATAGRVAKVLAEITGSDQPDMPARATSNGTG